MDRSLAHTHDPAEAALGQGNLVQDLDLQAVVLGHALGQLGEGLRSQTVGRLVDQITGQSQRSAKDAGTRQGLLGRLTGEAGGDDGLSQCRCGRRNAPRPGVTAGGHGAGRSSREHPGACTAQGHGVGVGLRGQLQVRARAHHEQGGGGDLTQAARVQAHDLVQACGVAESGQCLLQGLHVQAGGVDAVGQHSCARRGACLTHGR